MSRNDLLTRQWFLLKLLERPRGAMIEELAQSLTAMRGGPQIDVELCFDRKTSAWVKDRICHLSQRAAINRDNCLTLKLQVANTPELVDWILSFGLGVRAIKPQELNKRVKSTANKIAARE